MHKCWLNTGEVLKSHHWVLNALCLAQDVSVHVKNERKTKELIEAHRHSWGHVLQRTTISFRKVKPGLRSSQVLNQAILLPKGHVWRRFCCHYQGGSSLKTRDIAREPPIHRTDPTTQNHPAWKRQQCWGWEPSVGDLETQPNKGWCRQSSSHTAILIVPCARGPQYLLGTPGHLALFWVQPHPEFCSRNVNVTITVKTRRQKFLRTLL